MKYILAFIVLGGLLLALVPPAPACDYGLGVVRYQAVYAQPVKVLAHFLPTSLAIHGGTGAYHVEREYSSSLRLLYPCPFAFAKTSSLATFVAQLTHGWFLRLLCWLPHCSCRSLSWPALR